LHAPDDAARNGWKELGHTRQHDVFHTRLRQHLRQLVGKHVHHHQGLGLAVVELVHHLIDGVQGVGIDQHATGFEHTKGHDRKGQAVGQLHRHTITPGQTQCAAQVARKSVRQSIDLRKTQTAIHAVGHHAGESRFGLAVARPAGAVVVNEVRQIVVGAGGQIRGNADLGVNR
jgi:hypothetical protein